MVKIRNVLDVTSNDKGQLCYQDKPISKWWGKTYYYYNTETGALSYRHLTFFCRLFHLFGYAKKYQRADAKKLSEWKAQFNLCKATIAANPLKNSKIVSQVLHQQATDVERAVTSVTKEGENSPQTLPEPFSEPSPPKSSQSLPLLQSFPRPPPFPPPPLPGNLGVDNQQSHEPVDFFVVLAEMFEKVASSPNINLPWGAEGFISKDEFCIFVSNRFLFKPLMQDPKIYEKFSKILENRKVLSAAFEVTTDPVHQLCWVLLCQKSINFVIRGELLKKVFEEKEIKDTLSSSKTPILKALYEVLVNEGKLNEFLAKRENVETLISALNNPSEKQAITAPLKEKLATSLESAWVLDELQSLFCSTVALYAKKSELIEYFTNQNNCSLQENFQILSSEKASFEQIGVAISFINEHLNDSQDAINLFIEHVDPVDHFKAALYFRFFAKGIVLFSECCKALVTNNDLKEAVEAFAGTAGESFNTFLGQFKEVVAANDDNKINAFFDSYSNLGHFLDLLKDSHFTQAFNKAVKPLVKETLEKMVKKASS